MKGASVCVCVCVCVYVSIHGGKEETGSFSQLTVH